MQGLPSEAFDTLVRTLARICDDPYDPVFSAPVPPAPERPGRMTVLVGVSAAGSPKNSSTTRNEWDR